MNFRVFRSSYFAGVYLLIQDLTFTNYWNVLKNSIPLVFHFLRLILVKSCQNHDNNIACCSIPNL